jgi:hypothetical protein
MGTTYMNHDYLLQTELVTAREFADYYPTFETIMRDLLDTLFRLMYFIKDQKPAPEDGVQYFRLGALRSTTLQPPSDLVAGAR